MNKCCIVKDLLPLYTDDVCTPESKKFVAEHLAECEECCKELESYSFDVKVTSADEKKAVKSFKKEMDKKNFKKLIISISLCIALCITVFFACYYALFEKIHVVPYSDELLTVNLPEDDGIDVWVNLDNYDYVKMIDLRDSNGNLNVYLTVLQNNFSKIFPDSDKTDHLWRTNNDIAVCYQGDVPCPLGGDASEIKKIYYLEMEPNDLLTMLDNINFDKYNPTLIWSAP